jgi:hypothetical protein
VSAAGDSGRVNMLVMLIFADEGQGSWKLVHYVIRGLHQATAEAGHLPAIRLGTSFAVRPHGLGENVLSDVRVEHPRLARNEEQPVALHS